MFRLDPLTGDDGMQSWKPPLLAVVAVLYLSEVSASSVSPDADSRLEGLLDAVVTWLSHNFQLPANYEHPKIRLKPAEHISNIRYGAMNPGIRRQVVAVYDDETATIFLTESWRGKSPADISILVHEMVHHLQNRAGLSYGCPQEREELAYAAQERWLDLFGGTLEKEFDIDHLSLKLTTKCFAP